LFGSITATHIAANLREQGFEVADEIVRLPEHIKEVGTSQVILKFAPDLKATVTVTVVAEMDSQTQQDDESEPTDSKK